MRKLNYKSRDAGMLISTCAHRTHMGRHVIYLVVAGRPQNQWILSLNVLDKGLVPPVPVFSFTCIPVHTHVLSPWPMSGDKNRSEY